MKQLKVAYVFLFFVLLMWFEMDNIRLVISHYFGTVLSLRMFYAKPPDMQLRDDEGRRNVWKAIWLWPVLAGVYTIEAWVRLFSLLRDYIRKLLGL